MPTVQQIEPVVVKVEQLLAEAETHGVYLQIANSKYEDDWLFIVVVPSRPGVRASDHADLMSKIERQLRADGDNHILLVPVLED